MCLMVRWKSLFAACFMLVSSLAYCSTLKTEEACCSESLVDFQRTTRRHIPRDGIFQSTGLNIKILVPKHLLERLKLMYQIRNMNIVTKFLKAGMVHSQGIVFGLCVGKVVK
jgi:hypothetical protein